MPVDASGIPISSIEASRIFWCHASTAVPPSSLIFSAARCVCRRPIVYIEARHGQRRPAAIATATRQKAAHTRARGFRLRCGHY